MYAYRVSKSAFNQISKSMSADLKKDNIIVAAFHPGKFVLVENKNLNLLFCSDSRVLSL